VLVTRGRRVRIYFHLTGSAPFLLFNINDLLVYGGEKYHEKYHVQKILPITRKTAENAARQQSP
jgi:hypothetical protein